MTAGTHSLPTANGLARGERNLPVDAETFDRVSRTLGASPSRRRVVRLVSGLAVVGPITSLALPIAEAKRKKNKKKKKNQRCTPDPLAATCFHRCGTVTNNCGQAISCPGCSGGRQCLINGTCAMVCSTSADCTAACGCTASVDGTLECVVSGGSCADFPQTCSTTADCPAGQHCEQTGCGPGPSFENRCVALC